MKSFKISLCAAAVLAVGAGLGVMVALNHRTQKAPAAPEPAMA